MVLDTSPVTCCYLHFVFLPRVYVDLEEAHSFGKERISKVKQLYKEFMLCFLLEFKPEVTVLKFTSLILQTQQD